MTIILASDVDLLDGQLSHWMGRVCSIPPYFRTLEVRRIWPRKLTVWILFKIGARRQHAHLGPV